VKSGKVLVKAKRYKYIIGVAVLVGFVSTIAWVVVGRTIEKSNLKISEENWQTYTNTSYGYSIKYPKKWFINPEERIQPFGSIMSAQFFDIHHPANAKFPGEWACMVSIVIDSKEPSSEKWAKGETGSPVQTKNIQGFPGAKFIYDSWQDPMEASALKEKNPRYAPQQKIVKLYVELFILKDDRVYDIVGLVPLEELNVDGEKIIGTVPQSKRKLCRDTVDLMLESFRFL
jgi:hypothetical protein